MPEKTFPNALKQVRKTASMSQTELAKNSDVSLMSIRRYETGESFPKEETLGLIFLSLPDPALLKAWANDWKILYPTDPRDVDEIIKHIANDNTTAMRNFIVSIGKKESMDFLKPYHAITEMLLQLNADGIKAVHEFTKLMKQIPNHQK